MKNEQKTITNANEVRQNKPNVPTLRFSEFTKPWEKIELKSIIYGLYRKLPDDKEVL